MANKTQETKQTGIGINVLTGTTKKTGTRPIKAWFKHGNATPIELLIKGVDIVAACVPVYDVKSLTEITVNYVIVGDGIERKSFDNQEDAKSALLKKFNG